MTGKLNFLNGFFLKYPGIFLLFCEENEIDKGI